MNTGDRMRGWNEEGLPGGGQMPPGNGREGMPGQDREGPGNEMENSLLPGRYKADGRFSGNDTGL